MFVAVLTASAATSATSPSDETRELAKSIPLADLHMHVYGIGRSTPRNMLRDMERHNVRWGGGVGNYQTELQEKLGPRYIAAIGNEAWLTVFNSRGESGLTILDQYAFNELFRTAERLFKEGKLKGFGEIHVKNKTKFSAGFGRSIPLDSPVINRMYEIANQYEGFVQIHTMGGIFGGYEEISVIADRYPRALTILSHCLSGTPPHLLSKLFDKHPNVVCEISSGGLIHLPPPVGGRIFNQDGLRPEWAEVIERHPTRFFVGTDPCCGLEGRYGELIEEIRRDFLPYLTPATLRKVAYENAVERFNLPSP
ncbi:MAG: hypothetical protein FJY35_06395 [Betaproteobacteria bacterium]|nr:hypothetical protein [Betaproteobacteria bacterium]